VAFAPGATAIWFCPASSTVISATPDGPGATRSSAMSTPASPSPARNASPNPSVPTAPRNVHGAPARATATAWLAPLPPGAVVKS
jgi:hypothetical protein